MSGSHVSLPTADDPHGRIRVEGASMWPTLHAGDELVFVQTNDVRVGDIVVARQSNSLVAHRVVRAEGKVILTRGDAMRRADRPTAIELVLGRVTEVFRDGSRVPDYKWSTRPTRPVRVVGYLRLNVARIRSRLLRGAR
jgi:signal peptidase I